MASLSRAALRLRQPAPHQTAWAASAFARRQQAVTRSAASIILARGMAKKSDSSRFARSAATAGGGGNQSPQNQRTQPQQQQPRQAHPQPTPTSTTPQTQAARTPSTAATPSTSETTTGEPVPEDTPGPNIDKIDSSVTDTTTSTQSQEAQQTYQLPDLTQGIPSTLEYETAGVKDPAALAAIPEAAGGGRGRGELPASAYITSNERRRQKFANWAFGTAGVTIVAGTLYMGRNWDEYDEDRHPEIPNGWGVGLWWNRATTRMKEVLTYYHEPAFDKLLPDPDPMFARPYTLVISLEDMLVHSEWSREHGWRIAKRPGADYFLHYLSQYYEIVLFTTVPFAIGEGVVRKLDPYRFIVWPLYREATKFKDGEIVKDLSYLNRDLSTVISIDTSPTHVRDQPENAILLPKWTGDPTDKDLVSLIPFLEYIHTMQYPDVRKILASFKDTNIPTEFARREALARAEFNKSREGQRRTSQPHRKGQSGFAALGSLLGLKPESMSLMVVPEGEQNSFEAFAQGKMLQDIARERGQRQYEAMEKEIRENGAKWLEEEKVMQEKMQQEAMSSMKSGFVGWFLPGDGKKGEDTTEKKV